MKIGDKVQVWGSSEERCLGWGKIVAIAYRLLETFQDKEEVPLIQLEKDNSKIWGDECYWIDEKKAMELGLNVFKVSG